MCGIAGAITFKGKTESSILEEMIQTLKNRGPDNQNIFKKEINDVEVGLAHARLSIIDLTNGASQPMSFQQYTIVFNGEIYNYWEIRSELIKCGHKFLTQSDTEVVIHAFYQWKEEAVHKFIGMFAFVLLDEKEQKIYLFRDRAGVKPLYYFWNQTSFIFGSELKAILKHPHFEKILNHDAVGYYFKMGYVPNPLSIYKNTYKLNPGHFAVLDLKTAAFIIKKYWNSLDYFQKPKLSINYDDAKNEVEQLLISSCNYRMIADVPIGIFLSGGYDSTAVAALLQKDKTETLKTFTVGFDEGNNEAPFANQIAKFIGTDHYEYICTSKDAQDIIPQLPYHFDEPFDDSSAIPTLLVSKIARSQVKVALSADAGDELFAGYNSYRSLIKNINFLKRIEFADNKLLGKLLVTFSEFFLDESFLSQRIHYLGKLYLDNKEFRAAMIQEGAQSLSFKIYKHLIPTINYPRNLMLFDQLLLSDPVSVGQAVDYNLYFPNDILTKVDRASMAVSLEGREPLVDHRLFEFTAQLPTAYKFDGITSKKILKDIVHHFIPKELMDRPKTGFSLPVSNWLRGDLSYLIDEYLNECSIQDTGFFDPKYVKHLLKLFRHDRNPYQTIIWRILQFQMWHKTWI
ncbi:MAG: asparagine synthase (glutamine-hydrolyzing) [Ginsengibacter sp.]